MFVLSALSDDQKKNRVYNDRVKVGDKLDNFVYDTAYEKGLNIADRLDGKPCALLFLRYLGCTVCRVDLHKLIEEYNKIEQSGGTVKVVFQSEPDFLKEEVGDKFVPFEIICDPEEALYQKYGIKPAKNMAEMGAAIAVVKKVAESKKLGYSHGKYEGDELQLPACIVVTPDLTVKAVRYGKNAADSPTPTELAEMLKA